MEASPHTPGAVEERTRAWVQGQFVEGLAHGVDPAHAVFDPAGQPRALSRYHFQALQRKLKVLRWLERLRFSSFIDIGSGFDCYPWLVAERYGVDAYYSDMNHLMNMPFDGARSGKIDHAVTLNVTSLPFPDGAFDVVVSSEVLEHLVRPIEAIAELLRITRVCLIMTSLEALAPDRLRRLLSQWHVDTRVPHVERNFFVLDELRAIFGPGLRHENLLFGPTLPVSPFEPDYEQEAVYAGLGDRDALVQALCRAVSVADHGSGGMGILLLKPQPGVALESPNPAGDAELTRWLLERSACFEYSGFEASHRFWNGTAEFPERDSPIAPALVDRLRCPDCRAGFVPAGPGLACSGCGSNFAGSYGVPELLPTRERVVSEDECLARLCGGDQRRRRTVAALMRRLRRYEGPPSRLSIGLWNLERRLTRRG